MKNFGQKLVSTASGHWNFPQYMMIMIASNSRARQGGKERREVKGEYWRIWGELEGNADYLQENGTTQWTTCFTMFKKSWVGIRHENFDNGAVF